MLPSTAIALRLIRERGIVPSGWDRIAHCYFYGPVFSYHDLNILTCDRISAYHHKAEVKRGLISMSLIAGPGQ